MLLNANNSAIIARIMTKFEHDMSIVVKKIKCKIGNVFIQGKPKVSTREQQICYLQLIKGQRIGVFVKLALDLCIVVNNIVYCCLNYLIRGY